MSTVLVLPFHQDERLGDDSIPLPACAPAGVVEPRLAGGDQWQRLIAIYGSLASAVASSVSTSGMTTVLSGDCLAMLGTLAGVQRAGLDPGVVWFDAHGDVHTLSTSDSGYLGGMALRMAMGGDHTVLAGPLGIRPLPEDRALLVDARDLDHAEVDYLASSAVRRRTVADVEPADLPDGPVVVHVDVDVIDPGEIAGLRFPAPGGPTATAVTAAVHRLLASRRVAILDVACPWYDATDDGQQNNRRRLLHDLLPAARTRG